MKNTLRRLYHWSRIFGFDPRLLVRSVRAMPKYLAALRQYRKQSRGVHDIFPMASLHPCLNEEQEASGNIFGPYFRHDLLVAQRIFAANPGRHIDVGSRVDGFVAHVASFRPIEVLDIRSPAVEIPNITFIQCDLMGELPQRLVDSCDSLSSLSALEHFGLGRYGDRICAEGYLRGLENLHLILRPKGRIYLAVPIGTQCVAFNAHRVFSLSHLLAILEPLFALDRFSYLDDECNLHEGVQLTRELVDSSCRCMFGCAIIEGVKR